MSTPTLLKVLLPCFVCLSTLFFLPSCHNREKEIRLQQLDSLSSTMNRLDELIANLDENDFSERRDSIRLKLATLHKAGRDSVSGEMKDAVVKYFAIASNYDHFLNEYPIIVYEASRHRRALEELKTMAIAGHDNNRQFDELYRKEQQDVDALYKRTADLGYNTIAIDRDYTRTGELINPVYHAQSGK